MSANFIRPVPASRGNLQVIVLGRKSRPNLENQNESIEASMNDAESYLRRYYDDPIDFIRLGEQISGLVVDRETLHRTKDLIAARQVDIVLTEDIGRVFRNPRHMYAFVQDCVDADVRLIAVADNVDTADDNWETAMSIAAIRHGFTVPDTQRRVKRSAICAFEKGGNVQKIKFGYRKLSREEAASGQFGSPGLRIAKLSEWTPTIREIAARVKDFEAYRSYDDIAHWLREIGVPVTAYVTSGAWNGKLVLSLVRDEILMGYRTFGKSRCKRLFGTGQRQSLPNDAEPKSKKHYPELAHLTAKEFAELKTAIEHRARNFLDRKTGREHPRFQVPRSKAIFPAQHARCSVCGGTYYHCARDYFTCKNSMKAHFDTCWNHVQIDGTETRRAIIGWVTEQLSQFPRLRERAIEVACDEFTRLRKQSALGSNTWETRVTALEKEAQRLAKAIKAIDDSEELLSEFKEVNRQLREARVKREECLASDQGSSEFLTREDVVRQLEPALLKLAETSFRFADFLREILVRCEIVPIQAIDSGLVRPRVLVTMAINVPSPENPNEMCERRIDGVLNPFQPPLPFEHLRACMDAYEALDSSAHWGHLKTIARNLGIHYMTVKRSLELARQMKAEDLTEPYRVLTSPPQNASRWRRA